MDAPPNNSQFFIYNPTFWSAMNYRLQMPLSRFYLIAALISLLWLSGCAHRQLHDDNWPERMPSRDYFVSIYEADADNKAVQTQDEYLTWVLRFYQGWELYRRGWIRMGDELLAQIHNPAEADEIEEKVGRIGRLVAGEWAKKSNTRTIYLRHVSVWGNALLESLDKEQELPLINRINQDVDDLLARRIGKDVITADRYFAQDPDNPFL